MNNIYRLILPLLAAVVFLSCEDDEETIIYYHNNIDDNVPNVIDGTFPKEKIEASLGQEIVFSPELVNKDDVTVQWVVNGNVEASFEGSEDISYTYTVDGPCYTSIKLILLKGNNKVELESLIECLPDLENGFFVLLGDKYNRKTDDIAFYSTQTRQMYTNVYEALNQGADLPSGYMSVSKIGEKIYVARNTNISNYEHLLTADASTLRKIRSATVGTYIGPVTQINEYYGIIPSREYIFRVNLSTLSSVMVKRDYFAAAFNSIVLGDKLLVNRAMSTSRNVTYHMLDDFLTADNSGLGAGTELDIFQNGRCNFTKDAAGNVYTIGYNTTDSEYYLAKISQDLTTEKIVLPFEALRQNTTTEDLYTISIASSNDGNAIYIPAADHSIYRYVIGDDSSLTTPFISEDPESHLLHGIGMRVEPTTGDIYVMYYNGSNSGNISIFDSTSGVLKSSISCATNNPKDIIF